jgi:hypothetical protein
MPGSLVTNAVGRATGKIPGLRRLPVLRLLAIGEVMLLARDHLGKLEPDERRRLVELLRRGRGRPHNLSARDRDELVALIGKAEPRLFAGVAAEKLSPVRLPKRFVRGGKNTPKRGR